MLEFHYRACDVLQYASTDALERCGKDLQSDVLIGE